MATRKKSKARMGNIVAQNRKARHDYHLLENLEAGIVLSGSEVKSLRAGKASLVDAYAAEEGGEMYLFNAHIPEYDHARTFSHDPKRPRKLLLHKREIARLRGSIERKGMTLVPLAIYFNDRGIAKVELALAEGKRQYDKRMTERDRDWSRQKARLMRDKG